MRIDVVVNARARGTRSGDLPRALERVAGARARVARTASIEELGRTLGAVVDRGTDRLVFVGGDGTLMAGVTELARLLPAARWPELAVLPAGTVATVARNWGIPRDPVALLERLCRGEGASIVERSTLSLLDAGAARPRVGFIFGTGLVARFFETYEARGAGGSLAAARIVGRVFAESFWGGPFARRILDPMPCRVRVDGRLLDPTAFSLICAAVVRDLGIGMKVTYRATEDPARVHLVASPLPARALGPRAPRVLAGRTIGGPGHFDGLVGSFEVAFPDGGGAYVLDGDTFRTRGVTVTPGPRLRTVHLPP